MTTSSIPPADWLPVQESLIRGLNHALSNRLASLSAIVMLTDGAPTLDPKMHAALGAEAEQLGELLADYRALPSDPTPRRDAARFADALRRAQALLTHHPECRDVSFSAPAEDPQGEPVVLFGRDALRASVLLLLPLARAVGAGGGVETSIRGDDGWVLIVARLSANGPVGELESTREFAALRRFAEAEGGTATASPEGDAVTLTLPGLARARDARG